MSDIENIEEESSKDEITNSVSKEEIVNENIPQEQTIKTTQVEPQALQLQIENMEVHKHPHHVTHKKKWNEYLLEFFMLFLAVFLGFIAENIRENSVEGNRAKEYSFSLAKDLETDTTNLTSFIQANEELEKNYDSLLYYLKHINTEPANLIYYYFIPTTFYARFTSTERTIQQLENAGEMRLFRDMQLSDTITAYYEEVKSVDEQQATLLRYFDMYHEQAFQVFSYAQIDTSFFNREQLLAQKNYALKTSDPNTIDVLFSKLYVIRTITLLYINDLKELKTDATKTLSLLKEKM